MVDRLFLAAAALLLLVVLGKTLQRMDRAARAVLLRAAPVGTGFKAFA